MTYVPYIMIGAYFLILIVLTLRVPKADKKSTFEDFYTGSKSMGAIVVGLVMLVTYFSGSTWTGWTGFTALNGVFALYCVPYSVFAAVGMYFLATRVWPLGKEYRLSTLADMYELRYRSTGLKILTGLIGAVMNVTWITMEVVTIGLILDVASNGVISPAMGSLIGVIFMAGYTLWGGVKSVASVNTFQSILMVLGSIIVVGYLIISNYGSLTHMFEMAYEVNPASFVIEGEGMQAQWFSFVFLCSIGVLCYPSLYLKLYLGKSKNEVKKAAIFNAAGGVWALAFVFAGFAIIGYTAVSGVPVENPEQGLLIMLQNSGNPFIWGLALCFILAACMGTVDGTLLAISGILSSDVVEGFKKKIKGEPPIGEHGGEAQKSASEGGDNVVLLTRIIIVIVAAAAYLVTLMDLPLLVMIAMINYQGIAQLFIPLIGAVVWKKATKVGAFSGVIGGFGITIILMVMGTDLGGFLPGVLGVVVGTTLFIGVSIATYKDTLPEAKIYPQLRDTMKKVI